MDNIEFKGSNSTKHSLIKVIGVGGGGCNAVNYMYSQGVKGVDFAICNTDVKSLDKSPVPEKIQLGEGLGTGSKPEVGSALAQENIDLIQSLLHTETKMVFLAAGMGGGTGSGVSPVIAKLCRSLNILCVAIVTTPFSFEGNRRKRQAENAILALREHVDTLLIINNNKLQQIFGKIQLSKAFAQVDSILSIAVDGIVGVIKDSGEICVDFEDVKTVMENSGLALMGCAEGSGEDRVKKALSGVLTSPLLEDFDILGAKDVLLYFSYSIEYEVSMDEIAETVDEIQSLTGDEANIIWGYGLDQSMEERIRLTLVATGFGDF